MAKGALCGDELDSAHCLLAGLVCEEALLKTKVRGLEQPWAWAFAVALVFLLPPAYGIDPDDMQVVARWMRSMQYQDETLPSYGAITTRQDAACGQYYEVSPYWDNISVNCLLQTSVSDKLDIAERWIHWYLQHVNTTPDPVALPGTIFNHFYFKDGTGESVCIKASDPRLCKFEDGSDSNAGTFIGMVATYAKAGGERAKTFLAGKRQPLERVIGVIPTLQTQSGNGLAVARMNYPMEFTMDNSEVYFGMTGMAWLEMNVYDDSSSAGQWSDRARSLKAAITSKLLDPATGLYRVTPNDNANLQTWYPGTVQLVWPVLFGVDPPDSATSIRQMKALNDQWAATTPDWSQRIVASDQSPWSSVGYAAFLTGDTKRATQQVQFLKKREFNRFPGPFNVDDGGWLLLTITNALRR